MINAQRSMADHTPLQQAQLALGHILQRIKNDERVGWYLGMGTESFALATEAYATLVGKPVLAVRTAFEPKNAQDPAQATANIQPCLDKEEVNLLKAVSYWLDGQCSKTCLEAAHSKDQRGFNLLTEAARQGQWSSDLEDLANKRGGAA
jgi:hypothetical protein